MEDILSVHSLGGNYIIRGRYLSWDTAFVRLSNHHGHPASLEATLEYRQNGRSGDLSVKQ
jgi:hypothetical protein